MKAQFKYAFFAGLHVRGITFAVIFAMNVIFITLGSLGLLPFAVHIMAVSLGGIAIAVMFAANIGSDVALANWMFSPPKAYLHALTPAPRWKTLLAGIATMTVMDFVTMAIAIASLVWLTLILASGNAGHVSIEGNWVLETNYPFISVSRGILFVLLMIASYLLILMIIMFCVTMKKSLFYKLPASGFLTFLLACLCFYVAGLLQLALIPFSEVQRNGIFIVITLGETAMPMLILLTFLKAGALFFLTSKLMERINL